MANRSGSPRRWRRSLATRILLLFSCFAASLLCAAAAAPTQAAAHPVDPATMRQLRHALALAEQNNTEASLAIVNQVLRQYPRLAPALKLKGMIFEEAGRTDEASSFYQEALDYAPEDPDLLLKVGIHALVAGDRTKAVGLLAHCVRIAPDDGDAQFYLAQAYFLNGQIDPALQALRASMRLDPGNPAILQKYGEYLSSDGKYQQALQWLNKAQQAQPGLPGMDYDIGLARYQMMDLTGAENNLRRAVQLQPGDLHALQLLASVQVRLYQWTSARDSFTRALAIKPDDLDSLMGLGQCQVELRDDPAAIQTLRAVLHADPTRVLAHFYLSRAFAAMGQTAEAQHEAALHQLMMQEITFVSSEAGLARESAIVEPARRLLAQHNEAAALQLYRDRFRGTSASPAAAWVFVGKLYLYMGNRADGVRCLHHALQVDPAVTGASTYLGILALKDDDLKGAEQDFQAELARHPNYQMAIAEMGEVRYRQGRWADAAQLLAQSRTMTPQLLYMQCDADFHLHDVANADLIAEVTAAYGRSDPALMNGLIALLEANDQQRLASQISADIRP